VTTDVIILGSGPAGLALCASLAGRGLSTTLLAPDVRAPWAPTYGVWRAHLPPWAVPAVESHFDRATVDLGITKITMDRAYSRLRTDRLQQLMLERCASMGARFLDDAAVEVRHDRDGSVVRGREDHAARLVIDATGTGALAGTSPATLFQTAYGVVAEADGAPRDLVWMDFSHAHGDGREPATFLYVIPMPDGRVFLEETSLARVGGLPFAELEARLRRRLAATGVTLRRVDHVERCVIGLDRRPAIGGRTLAYGAAGGMVHPATGYQIGRSFAQADGLADVIAATLAQGPQAAASAGWAALWPNDRRARFAMYRFGSRAVSRFGADDTRRFFTAFFQRARWQPWLDDELTFAELSQQMARVFSGLPLGVQLRLLKPWSEARPRALDAQPLA
jgi:lycopene beta-cyclase